MSGEDFAGLAFIWLCAAVGLAALVLGWLFTRPPEDTTPQWARTPATPKRVPVNVTTMPSLAAIFGIPAVVRNGPAPQRPPLIPMYWLDLSTGEQSELVEDVALPMLPGDVQAN